MLKLSNFITGTSLGNVNTQNTSSYQFVLEDKDGVVVLNNPTTISVTVPANSTVAFSVKTCIDVIQAGNGGLTFSAANGVTIKSRANSYSTNTQYSKVSLVQSSIDTWYLTGDIVYIAPMGSRAVFVGGNSGTVLDYITIETLGNATYFGELTMYRYSAVAASSTTRLIAGGGFGTTYSSVADYITIATLGNAVDFGTLTVSRSQLSSASNSTRALFAGGYTGSNSNVIDYITIASTGNAIDFGDLTAARSRLTSGGAASPTRALFGGGWTTLSVINIDYMTIASTGNALNFGNLSVIRSYTAATSSSTRAIFAGGTNSVPTLSNVIDYVTIASTGNATDFGDLSVARSFSSGASSNHGGLQV